MILAIPANANPLSDKMAILISELQSATATTTERQAGHWIGYHSDELRSLLGGRYRDTIEQTIDAGFIETNEKYSNGRFTKSYRLSKQYRTPKTRRYQIRRSTSRIRLADDDTTGLRLADCFRDVSLPARVSATGWSQYGVQAIRGRSWYAVRCPYRRLHTTFTGLPKRIRSSLLICGKQVVELDVANCQPLILGMLAGRASNQTTPNPTQPNTQLGTYTICRTNSDLKLFLELCSAGHIYEHLLEQCRHLSLHNWIPLQHRHRNGVDRPLKRSDIKNQLVIMMFAKNATTKRMKLFEVFANEFPTIADYIIEAKRIEYQALARDCQRFESGIMIDTVAASLVASIPIITIHDSIICNEDNADQVTDAIRSRFAALGCGVTIKQN